jgi:hypothetical protein
VSGDSGTIEAGRAAWARLRGDRKSWTDWLAVARAIEIGKAEVMKAAKTNRAVGTTYNRLMGEWLCNQGLEGVTASERFRLLKILEHLTEIGSWRNSLDEGKRRALNHPSSIWSHWRRSLKPAPSPPRQHLTERATSARQVRGVFWPQDALRRAHQAMLKSKSSDLLVLARAALESAIRCEADLVELLDPRAGAMPALPQRADIGSAAGHVG